MDEVIAVSSDSDKDEDSDVEIVGSFCRFKDDPLPLSAVRVDVDALNINIPSSFIDLTDARRVVPELKTCKKRNSTASPVIDLTESGLMNGSEQENLPPNDCQIRKENINGFLTSIRQDSSLQKVSGNDLAVVAPVQDSGVKKAKQRRLDSHTQLQKLTKDALSHHLTPLVNLRRLPFLETYVRKLKKRHPLCLSKELKQTSLSVKQLENQGTLECTCALRITTVSNGLNYKPTVESPVLNGPITEKEQAKDSNSLDTQLRDKEPQNQQIPSANLDNRGSGAALKEHSTEHKDMMDSSSTLIPSPAPSDLAHNKAQCLPQIEVHSTNTSSISEAKNEDMDEGSENGSYRGDVRRDSPVSIDWEAGTGEEDAYLDSKLEWDFRGAPGEDRHYVSPNTVKRIRIGRPQFQISEEEEGTPEMLCRRSLSLVYSTIDEKYPEGTLQILSDLLQPGYYPPKDITSHLLHDILLDTQCPHHLCVQAFNLLMRTQRHHFTDKSMIPWDWELLTSVMASQDHTKTYRWEVVRMLLEYVLQTLEDDFKAKRASFALYHSIAKNMLSCDQKFPQVRDIIKWLFSAIVKSTEKSKTAAEERDEQIKMVCIFQRMLSLALEVDCSPALNSAKVSQELFHMLISDVPLRAHRMLLLESLQSKPLRCKLLEHLLDYACPVKTPLPMSLSLLLHFLKNCTLTPDPTDGDDRWQRWEELVHLLWMLLLSYSSAMKGYLSSSITGQRDRGGTLIYRPDDMVSKSAVCEAVKTFLSRSQDDLGKVLPQHVEESLTYLQDHLLNVCQC